MEQQLLLISNSKTYGGGYLNHCRDEIRDFLGKRGTVLFVPYALKDHDAYASVAGRAFQDLGYGFESIHRSSDKTGALNKAYCIFVGGGNTFRLLDALDRYNLLPAIRTAVRSGTRYIGSSAGSNIAAPTIRTTNDMPIVQPRSFDALGLVTFQINPHYLDTDPKSTHMGETREQRLREYHEENDTPVIALREGSWLRVTGKNTVLKGKTGAKLFLKGQEPVEATPGQRIVLP